MRKTPNRTGSTAAHGHSYTAVPFSIDAPRTQRRRSPRTASPTLVRSGNGVQAKPNIVWASMLRTDFPSHIVEGPSAQEAPRKDGRVAAAEEVAVIEEEVEEEGEAAERGAEPATPKATSAMRVRTILACGRKGAAPLRRGPGTSTVPA